MSYLYDDSDWPYAVIYGQNRDSTWGEVSSISPLAKWIWITQAQYSGFVYCRKNIGMH